MFEFHCKTNCGVRDATCQVYVVQRQMAKTYCGSGGRWFESTQLYQDLAPQADANGNELPGGWRVVPELAAGGLWSSAMDLARLSLELERAYRGESGALLASATARAMMTQQNGGPFGLGAAVAGNGASRVLMKRGQNIGYQSYMLLFPETGQGIVVLTGSDNGTTLATALIRRAAVAYQWPQLGPLLD